VPYSVAVTDNDVGFCQQQNQYNFFFNSFDPTLTESFDSSTFQVASPGETVTFQVGLTSSDLASFGTHEVAFSVEDFGPAFEDLQGQLTYDLARPTGSSMSRRNSSSWIRAWSTTPFAHRAKTQGAAL
jgi:hypothetical protein